MVMQTFKSRITQLNPSVGSNTHEIVINRLIELWETETEESRKLFNDIAERLAKYDNPKRPPILYDNHKKEFYSRVRKNNSDLFSKYGATQKIVYDKVTEWLKFNR